MSELSRSCLRLVYDDCGSGPHRPVLLVHGWGCNRSFLQAQLEFFSQSRRTVAVDLRGHGESDTSHFAFTIESFADNLAWLCRRLDLVKPIVVGHDMGGTIALDLAGRYPDIASAVVMIDSSLFLAPSELPEMRVIGDELKTQSYLRAVEKVASLLFSGCDDQQIRRSCISAMSRTPQHVLAAAFDDHMLRYDPTPAARHCTVPIAYIGSEHPYANVKRLREALPRLTIGQTVGTGHFSPLLVPDQINGMVRDFASKCERAQ